MTEPVLVHQHQKKWSKTVKEKAAVTKYVFWGLHDLTNAHVQTVVQAFGWNIYHDQRDSVFGTKDYSFMADRERLCWLFT